MSPPITLEMLQQAQDKSWAELQEVSLRGRVGPDPDSPPQHPAVLTPVEGPRAPWTVVNDMLRSGVKLSAAIMLDLFELEKEVERGDLSRFRQQDTPSAVRIHDGSGRSRPVTPEQTRRALFRRIGELDPKVREEGAAAIITAGAGAVAPALMAMVEMTSIGLRIGAGHNVTEAFEGSLTGVASLAEPLEEILRKTGQTDLADLIVEHPVMAELLLNVAHDGGAILAFKGLRSLMTPLKATDPLLGPNQTRQLEEFFQSNELILPTSAALERAEGNVFVKRGVLEQFVEGMEALSVARERAAAAARAVGQTRLPTQLEAGLERVALNERQAVDAALERLRGGDITFRPTQRNPSEAAIAESARRIEARGGPDPMPGNIEVVRRGTQTQPSPLPGPTPLGPVIPTARSPVVGTRIILPGTREAAEQSERLRDLARVQTEGVAGVEPRPGPRLGARPETPDVPRPQGETLSPRVAGATADPSVVPRDVESAAMVQGLEEELQIPFAQRVRGYPEGSNTAGRNATIGDQFGTMIEHEVDAVQRLTTTLDNMTDVERGIAMSGLTPDTKNPIVDVAEQLSRVPQQADEVIDAAIRAARAGGEIPPGPLKELVRGMMDAGVFSARQARQIARQGKVDGGTALRMSAESGKGMAFYTGLPWHALSPTAKKVLLQSGAWVAGIEMEKSDLPLVSGIGQALQILAPLTLGGTLVLKSNILPRSGNLIVDMIEKTKGRDAANSFGRWFISEFRYSPEVRAVVTQMRGMMNYSRSIAAEDAGRIFRLANKQAELTRAEARAAGFNRREADVFAKGSVGTTRRALSDFAEGEGPEAGLRSIHPSLHDEAMELVTDIFAKFEEFGQQYVDLVYLTQEIFEKRAGNYLPRFYLDLEAKKLDEIPDIIRKRLARRGSKGPPRIDPTDAMRRNDHIPYEIRVNQMNEIRELDYRVLAGYQRAMNNAAMETAYQQIRALPNRVWKEWDNAQRALDEFVEQRRLVFKAGGTKADLKLWDDDIALGKKALADLEAEVPAGFRKTGDHAGLGSLRNTYVNEETWLMLKDFEKVSTPGGATKVWNRIMAEWRINMTAMNMPTHMGNIGSAFMQAHLIGGLPWWRQDVYRTAWRDVRSKGTMYREFQKLGGITGSTAALAREGKNIGSSVDVLRGLVGDANGNVRSLLGELNLEEAATRSMVGYGAEVVGKKAKKFRNALLDLYQSEDELFKVAVYTWHRKHLGKTADEAFQMAQTALVDYSQRSGFINFVRNTAAPFFTFGAKTAGPLARAIVEHPERVPLALAPFIILNESARNLIGVPAFQPRGEKRHSFLDIRYTQIPVISELGPGGKPKADFFNSGRFTPMGPFITGGAVEQIFPSWWPQALSPSHPLISAAMFLNNKDPRTGNPIIYEFLDSPLDVALKVGHEAAKLSLPSSVVRNLPNALDAAIDREWRVAGRELAGVLAVRPFSVEQSGRPQVRAVRAELRRSQAELRRRVINALQEANTPEQRQDAQEWARTMRDRLTDGLRAEMDEIRRKRAQATGAFQ